MIGSTLYLTGRDAQTGEILNVAEPCSMCKRLIINAGIALVVSRVDENNYKIWRVSDWVDNDDTIESAE